MRILLFTSFALIRPRVFVCPALLPQEMRANLHGKARRKRLFFFLHFEAIHTRVYIDTCIDLGTTHARGHGYTCKQEGTAKTHRHIPSSTHTYT